MPDFPGVRLRAVESSDIEVLVQHMQDPEAQRMAVFVAEDWSEPQGIIDHWNRVLANPDILTRSIELDGELVGHLATWVQDGEREVTYWIDRSQWGKGIATQALALFLNEVRDRPIFARCVADNSGSIRVLQKCGFQQVGSERFFARIRSAEVEERVFRLDG